MDKNIIDSATTDYLSWEYLRNNDFRDGRFSQEDLNNTYSNLYNSWNEKKLRVNMQPTLNSEDKGKALYLDCLEEKVYISFLFFSFTASLKNQPIIWSIKLLKRLELILSDKFFIIRSFSSFWSSL